MRGVGLFTGWSRDGLARWPTREGKNQCGWLAGERLRHVALRRSGWEENVEQQKLAVGWTMLRIVQMARAE